MASEQAFWKNFCNAVGRTELFERWPGSRYADHARGNRELQRELRDIFKTKSSAEWIGLGEKENFPIAPVNSPRSIAQDSQFKDRFPLYSRDSHGAEMLPFPVRFPAETLPEPSWAPRVGEHSEAVLREVLGYDTETISRLKSSGALG
jgi:crotonobetainyl-CoA:carnitine CoA-transferase CaiB-like acyl-CoA transferase